MLGSSTHRMEQDGTRAGTQHTRDGILLDTDTGRLVPERFGIGEGDSDCVTQHQERAEKGTGGGALRPAAREHLCRSPLGDEAHAGDSHALQRGVCRLGEQASGGSPSGMEIESGVIDRGHCQLRTERGKFCVDNGTAEMVRCRGIRTTKRCNHRRAYVSGTKVVREGSRGHTPG